MIDERRNLSEKEEMERIFLNDKILIAEISVPISSARAADTAAIISPRFSLGAGAGTAAGAGAAFSVFLSDDIHLSLIHIY